MILDTIPETLYLSNHMCYEDLGSPTSVSAVAIMCWALGTLIAGLFYWSMVGLTL